MRSIIASLYLINVVVFFGGCHSKVANLEIAPQKINLDNLASDTISFDSLFYDVKFIPLENNRNAMLSHVSKLIVTKEQYIVFDTGIIPSVLLFDKEGGFKCQVGSMGHGRGEYQYIFDLSADDENNIVISTFDRFMIYDSEGKFRQAEEAPENSYMKNIQCYAGGLICASNYSGSASLLHIFNKSYEQIYELLPSNGISLGNPPRMNRTLNVLGDSLYYFNPYTSEVTLISLPEHKILKHYSLVSKNILNLEKSKEEESPKNDIGDVDAVYNYYIDNGKIECNLSYHEIGTILEIDVANDKYALRIQDGWFPEIFDVQDEYYYSILSQEDLLDLVNHKLYTTPKTRSMISNAYGCIGRSLTEKDNFIIMRFKRKES